MRSCGWSFACRCVAVIETSVQIFGRSGVLNRDLDLISFGIDDDGFVVSVPRGAGVGYGEPVLAETLS